MTLQAHILVVDQDRSFSRGLSNDLRTEGFDVSVANCGDLALEMVEDSSPDLLMTERRLTGTSGIELCRRVKARSQTRDMPILMLATQSDTVDLARALDLGVDDFVHKPVTALEIVARTKALLRRTRPSTVGESITYQDIAVDTQALRAFRGDNELSLGPTELSLLTIFVEKPRRVWTREQLMDTIWGHDAYIDQRTVDVHIGRLRKTLRNNGDGDPFRTIRGAGYSLG